MRLKRFANFVGWCVKKKLKRQPDRVIGVATDPYLLRWYVLPRNRFLNIYLHRFMRSDDARALHDHPWASLSIILERGYVEVLPKRRPDCDPVAAMCGEPSTFDYQDHEFKVRMSGDLIFRGATDAHRVALIQDIYGRELSATTLFLTGPVVRDWGFWCPAGWRHWRDFTIPSGNEIGPGCD